MLACCKITKFWEVNFKILARILATPVVIAAANKSPEMIWCKWCGDRANIDYILLHCPFTHCVHWYVEAVLRKISQDVWILGGVGPKTDQVIWVVNFLVYKAHLQACHGKVITPLDIFQEDILRFSPLYSGLACIVKTSLILSDNG